MMVSYEDKEKKEQYILVKIGTFPCCPDCLADLLIYRTDKSGLGTAMNWSRVDRVSVRLFT